MGAKVDNLQHEYLGQIKELVDNGAQTVLVLEDGENKNHLIPFVEAFIIEVDLQSDPKKVIVDWQKDW